MLESCETCRIKCKDYKCFLKYIKLKDDLIEYRYSCYNNNYWTIFDEKLKKKFANTCKSFNHDINNFFHCYKRKYEGYGRNSLKFHYIKMENIIDADYAHAKRVYKGFGKRNLGGYYDLYVQSVTLLLADVFENFRNMCLEIYELDPAHFFPH